MSELMFLDKVHPSSCVHIERGEGYWYSIIKGQTTSPGFLLLMRSTSTWQTFDKAWTPASLVEKRMKVITCTELPDILMLARKVITCMETWMTMIQRAHRKQKKKNPSVIVAQENTWSSQQN